MYYAMIVLIALTALLLLRGLIALIRDPWRVEGNQVILSKLLLLIGVPGGAFFMIPTCITLFTGESPWLSLGFLLFSWLACSMIVGYLNCRITFSDTDFTVKNFLGFRRTYNYTDITKIRHTAHHDWLYVGHRRVLIDEMAVNGDRFLDMARKRYRTHHHGNAIPTVPKSKNDLFRGNVASPGEFIFAFILVYAVLLIVFVVLLIVSRPLAADDLEFTTISPTRYSLEEEDILLYIPQSDLHFELNSKLLEDPQGFLALCTQEELTLGVQYVDNADTPYYKICCITRADGSQLLSLDRYNAERRGGFLFGCCMLLIPVGLWTGVVAMVITVGRHPEKSPPWFTYLFIQKTALLYQYPVTTSRRKKK